MDSPHFKVGIGKNHEFAIFRDIGIPVFPVNLFFVIGFAVSTHRLDLQFSSAHRAELDFFRILPYTEAYSQIVMIFGDGFFRDSDRYIVLFTFPNDFSIFAVFTHRLELQLSSAERTELNFYRMQGKIPILPTGCNSARIYEPKQVLAIPEVGSRLEAVSMGCLAILAHRSIS